jgi:hypothetical protein
LVTLSALFAIARSQTVDVQGTLVDRYSERPLSQAKVSLAKLGLEGLTDSAGRFHFVQVPTGSRGDGAPAPLRMRAGRMLAFRSARPGPFALRLVDPAGTLVPAFDPQVFAYAVTLPPTASGWLTAPVIDAGPDW